MTEDTRKCLKVNDLTTENVINIVKGYCIEKNGFYNKISQISATTYNIGRDASTSYCV